MKMEENKSALNKKNIKELKYSVNEKNEIITELSDGWEPKTIALDYSLEIINERIEEAKNKVRKQVASPILYFMEKNKMDSTYLADCLKIPIVLVKLHLKPMIFNYLSKNIKEKYAKLFNINLSELDYDLKNEN